MLPLQSEVESVSEFTARVKYVLEKEIRASWIRGEVSNLRRQASGHVYFSVKDAGSQVSAVMFRGDAAKQDVELRDGMQVVVFGEISVYPPRGGYQLIIRMVLEDGVGRLQQEFEQLKAKLDAEGLFAAGRKRPIPRLPRVVGIITSSSGAALQDFLRILRRRGWGGRVVVLAARVQGVGAASEMIRQLQEAEALGVFDLLVIGRGGGSLEDLWCFNDEALVRAMADCPIPIISAVGHEIDFTLSDFVADRRAETPSAAAEIISSHFVELLQEYRDLKERLDGAVDWQFDECHNLQEGLEHRLGLLHPKRPLELAYQRLDDVAARFQSLGRESIRGYRQQLMDVTRNFHPLQPVQRVSMARMNLQNTEDHLNWVFNQVFSRPGERLERLEQVLKSLSPESVLKRGFVMLSDNNSEGYISRAKDLVHGQKVQARFADGVRGLSVE